MCPLRIPGRGGSAAQLPLRPQRRRAPRPGMRSGHIPGSVCLPYDRLFRPEDGTLLPAAALREVFDKAGVEASRPVVTTCGSGVSAAVLALGLHVVGRPE